MQFKSFKNHSIFRQESDICLRTLSGCLRTLSVPKLITKADQRPINLGKKLLRISCIRKIAVIWILARIFAKLPSFFSQSDLIRDLFREICLSEQFLYWKTSTKCIDPRIPQESLQETKEGEKEGVKLGPIVNLENLQF